MIKPFSIYTVCHTYYTERIDGCDLPMLLTFVILNRYIDTIILVKFYGEKITRVRNYRLIDKESHADCVQFQIFFA